MNKKEMFRFFGVVLIPPIIVILLYYLFEILSTL